MNISSKVYIVMYLVSLKCLENVRLVVTVIANFPARGISFSVMSNWIVLYNVHECKCTCGNLQHCLSMNIVSSLL